MASSHSFVRSFDRHEWAQWNRWSAGIGFRVFCVLISILLTVDTAESAEALSFVQRTLRFSPTADDMIVTATFAFTNASDRQVTLTQVRSSCSCVSIQPPPKLVQPGEHGEIVAVMELGTLAGIQIKGIAILTDHPDEPRVDLSMEVTIPPTPIIITGGLTWEQGKPEPVRGLVIVCPPAFPFLPTAVTTNDPRLEATLNPPTTDPRRFTVTVRVTDANRPFSGRVEVTMGGSAKRFPIPAMVIPVPGTRAVENGAATK